MSLTAAIRLLEISVRSTRRATTGTMADGSTAPLTMSIVSVPPWRKCCAERSRRSRYECRDRRIRFVAAYSLERRDSNHRHKILLQRPPDWILAGAISRGMREHFWIGIQVTGEVARCALPGEFLVEARDESPGRSNQAY